MSATDTSAPYEIRIVRRDDQQRELQTVECGGLLRAWNHLIQVEPLSENSCKYTDEVEVRAGLLTLLAWLLAHGFFRYRQRRLRRFVRLQSKQA